MLSLDKLKQASPTINTDADPIILASQLRAVEAIAYSVQGAEDLEGPADCKLGRPPRAHISAFQQYPDLLDDSWDDPPLDETAEEAAAEEPQEPANITASTPYSYAVTSRSQLSKRAIAIDLQLLTWLQSITKGSSLTSLYHLPKRSFVMGIVVLWRALNPSRFVLKWAALDELESCVFDGEDVRGFRIRYQNARINIRQHNVTVDDIEVRQMLKSGLPSHVAQNVMREIASKQDVNPMEVLNQELVALDATNNSSNQLAMVNNATTAARAPRQFGKCKRCGRDDCVPNACFRNRDINGKVLDKGTKTEQGKLLGIRAYEESNRRAAAEHSNSNRNAREPLAKSQYPLGGTANSAHAQPNHEEFMTKFKGMDTDSKMEAIMNYQMEQMLSTNESNGKYDVISLYNIYKTFYGPRGKGIKCILDSGAGIHLSKHAQNLDTQSRIMVAGFNGSTETTNGVGDLPCTFTDALTNDVFEFTFMGVHGHNGVKTLISLGLVLRAGPTLEAQPTGDTLLYTPARTRCIAVTLGDENILHFTCTNKTGRHLVAPRNLPKAERHHTVPKGPIAQWEVCVA